MIPKCLPTLHDADKLTPYPESFCMGSRGRRPHSNSDPSIIGNCVKNHLMHLEKKERLRA